MKTPHTGVWKGKRVQIVLKNGFTYIGKFVERTSKYVFLMGDIKIERGKIKSFKIIKS